MNLNWIHGQQADHHQQDHGLRRRGAKVLPDEPVRKDFVHQNRGRLLRPTRGDRVDDPEGLEEGINHVHDQQKEGRRGQKRQNNRPEPAPETGPVNGRRLDHRFAGPLEGPRRRTGSYS